MNITHQSIVGELVAHNYRTARVFNKYGIDYCCNGNRSIEEACKKRNIETDTLIGSLKDSLLTGDNITTSYNTWPIDLLADYIEKKHHRYVQEQIAEILPCLDKIVKVHGSHHPELTEVLTLFRESSGELTAHMKKEELILFPVIRNMVSAGKIPQRAPFDSVQQPIDMMMHEHDGEGERFRKIAALTNNYTPPADACNTYRVGFELLKEFEADLHLHIHLENNILFPKAVALEKQLTARDLPSPAN